MNGLQTAHNVRNLIKIGLMQIEIQNQKRYDLFVTRDRVKKRRRFESCIIPAVTMKLLPVL